MQITIQNLIFKYSEEDEALFNGIDIVIENGMWLLLGKNGIGKSTFLNLLKAASENQNFGYTNSDSYINISGHTIHIDDSIAIPTQLREKAWFEYIMSINRVVSREAYIPLDNTKKMLLYSTGEKKVVLFRILSKLRPDVLLIDEYLTNLDKENMERVLEMLNGMVKRGTIVIVSSHDDVLKKYIQKQMIIEHRKLVVK